MSDPGRFLLVSIHDVSPGRLKDVIGLRNWLAERGVASPTLLVVPHHHRAEPWSAHPGAAGTLRYLASCGDEILLHGLVHQETEPAEAGSLTTRLQARFLTAGEGEFLRLSEADAASRLTCGWSTLESLGLRPAGFVAPAWLYSEGTRRALAARGPVVYEDNLYLCRADGRRLRSPVLALSTRRADRLLLSVLWCEALSHTVARAPVARIALHPPDLHSPLGLEVLGRILGRLLATHRPTSYATAAKALWG